MNNTKRTIAITSAAIALAIGGGAAGYGIATLTHTDAPSRSIAEPVQRTPDVCDELPRMMLDNANMLALAWQSGTAYNDSVRTDNIDVYASLIEQCE